MASALILNMAEKYTLRSPEYAYFLDELRGGY